MRSWHENVLKQSFHFVFVEITAFPIFKFITTYNSLIYLEFLTVTFFFFYYPLIVLYKTSSLSKVSQFSRGLMSAIEFSLTGVEVGPFNENKILT